MELLWRYVWKDSDGSRHESMIEAPTKEWVFENLRKKGIKAVKVEQVLRKRDRTILYLKRFGFAVIAALLAAIAAYTLGRRETQAGLPRAGNDSLRVDSASAEASPTLTAGDRVARPLPRKQLDVSGVDLSDVFKYEAERFLVHFISPGCVHSGVGKMPPDLFDALEAPIVIRSGDPQKIVDVKRIVCSLKQEITQFRASGKSLNEICDWLKMRQQMEYEFRLQLIGGREKDAKSKDSINDKLRAMGLAEIK